MAFTEALCPKIQQSLIEVFGSSEASNFMRTPVGLLDALVSNYNTANTQQVRTNDPTGRKKDVEVYFIQQAGVASAVTAKQDVCGAATEQAPIAQTVSANLYRGSQPKELSQAEMRKVCFDTTDGMLAKMIMAQMDAVNRSIDIALLTKLAANFGHRFGDNSSATVAVPILKTDGSVNYPGIARALEDYHGINGTGAPIFVGAGNLALAVDMLGIGCCNDQGIDLSRANGKMAYFRDLNANTVLGANQFAVLMPGSHQLVTYNEYVDEFAQVVPGIYENGTLVDPITGLMYDFRLNYDNCTGTYKFTVGLFFDLWQMPTNIYETDDALNGVNGSLRFTGTQLP